MTEKLLTFPSPPPPLLPPETLGMGLIGQKSTFFQNSITTQTNKDICTGTCAVLGLFLSGGRGVQGSRLLNLFYGIYTEGVQCFFHTFSRGGPTFSMGRGGGGYQMLISIKTHITTTYDFPGDPLSPPLWIRKWAVWNFGTNLCGLLLSLETPNANLSIVLSD